jgi:hypothetical protein
MYPILTKSVAEAHVEDLHQEAARARTRRAARKPPRAAREDANQPITIRLAGPDDGAVLARLAELDSAAVPSAPILIADADGQARAALSLRDGAAIADPLHPTAAILQLLITRAAQLTGERSARRRGIARLHIPHTTLRRST